MVVLISVYFGFWLNGLARTKKDKKEAKQIFNILHDEIKSNLDNNLNKDSSYEYLSVLGEEILKAKMGILATHYKDPLDNFIKRGGNGVKSWNITKFIKSAEDHREPYWKMEKEVTSWRVKKITKKYGGAGN